MICIDYYAILKPIAEQDLPLEEMIYILQTTGETVLQKVSAVINHLWKTKGVCTRPKLGLK